MYKKYNISTKTTVTVAHDQTTEMDALVVPIGVYAEGDGADMIRKKNQTIKTKCKLKNTAEA